MEWNEEKIIGKIIHNRFPIEWMRYNMFYSENIYRNIPLLVFRLREEELGKQLEGLQNCIASFKGETEWKVFKDPLSQKGNYLLTLAIMEDFRRKCHEKGMDYNEQEFLGSEKYKSCCEEAVHDIPLLAKHIEHYLE